jgi:hypothetical protein
MKPYDSSIAGDAFEARRRPPLGVAIVALITLMTAVVNAPRLLHLIGAPSDWILALGWISVLQVLTLLLIGIGLWYQQDWARKLAIGIYGLLLFLHVLEILRQQVHRLSLADVLIYGAIIVYFLLPSTRARFES